MSSSSGESSCGTQQTQDAPQCMAASPSAGQTLSLQYSVLYRKHACSKPLGLGVLPEDVPLLPFGIASSDVYMGKVHGLIDSGRAFLQALDTGLAGLHRRCLHERVPCMLPAVALLVTVLSSIFICARAAWFHAPSKSDSDKGSGCLQQRSLRTQAFGKRRSPGL